jgi:hypothetical protein
MFKGFDLKEQDFPFHVFSQKNLMGKRRGKLEKMAEDYVEQ